MGSRRTLRVAVLALLVVLAGCSEVPVGLTPGIEDVRERGGSTYEVTMSVDNRADTTFHDVQIVGYTARGDRACTADVGTVSTGTENVTATCDGFPAVLVPAPAEPCQQTPEDSSELIEHDVTAFVGYRDGSYSTERIATKTCDEPYGREVGQTLPPGDHLFQYVRCRQWADDANVSIIDERPWMDRDRADPDVTTSYSVRVVDNNSTTIDHVQRSKSPLPEAEVSETVREFLVENLSGPPVDGQASRAVSQKQWLRLYDALDDRSIDSMADIPDPDGSYRTLSGPHSKGTVSDKRRVDCWGSPEYLGSLSLFITYLVEYDDRQWYVQLDYERAWSGQAVANRSD